MGEASEVSAPVMTLGETLPCVPWSLWEELPGSLGTNLAQGGPLQKWPRQSGAALQEGAWSAQSGQQGLPWGGPQWHQSPPVLGAMIQLPGPSCEGLGRLEEQASSPRAPPRDTLGQRGEVRAQLQDLRAHGFGGRDSHLGVRQRGWGGRAQPDIGPTWPLATPLYPSTPGGSYFSCSLSPEFPRDAGMPSPPPVCTKLPRLKPSPEFPLLHPRPH